MEEPPLSRRCETPDDAEFRLTLFRETHGGILVGLAPALAETLLIHQLAGQAMTYAARYPAARTDIVECDGAPIGRIVTDHAADAFALVDIALLAACRGRGFGTRLIAELVREADAAGVPVHLNVAHDNPAQRLYAKLGFVAVAANETHVAMRRSPGA